MLFLPNKLMCLLCVYILLFSICLKIGWNSGCDHADANYDVGMNNAHALLWNMSMNDWIARVKRTLHLLHRSHHAWMIRADAFQVSRMMTMVTWYITRATCCTPDVLIFLFHSVTGRYMLLNYTSLALELVLTLWKWVAGNFTVLLAAVFMFA